MNFTQDVYRSSSERGVLDICINVLNDQEYERPIIGSQIIQVVPGGTAG